MQDPLKRPPAGALTAHAWIAAQRRELAQSWGRSSIGRVRRDSGAHSSVRVVVERALGEDGGLRASLEDSAMDAPLAAAASPSTASPVYASARWSPR
jgi:hypothetical protein